MTTIVSYAINFPAIAAIINFQKLYFATPKWMVIGASGMGVADETMTASQPYLVMSLCSQ